jgi:hypothetical protein
MVRAALWVFVLCGALVRGDFKTKNISIVTSDADIIALSTMSLERVDDTFSIHLDVSMTNVQRFGHSVSSGIVSLELYICEESRWTKYAQEREANTSSCCSDLLQLQLVTLCDSYDLLVTSALDNDKDHGKNSSRILTSFDMAGSLSDGVLASIYIDMYRYQCLSDDIYDYRRPKPVGCLTFESMQRLVHDH